MTGACVGMRRSILPHGGGLAGVRHPLERRRAHLDAFVGGLFVLPDAWSQTAGRVYRIGVIAANPLGDRAVARLHESLLQRLRELGYVEDKNLRIERRSAEGRAERLPDLAAE